MHKVRHSKKVMKTSQARRSLVPHSTVTSKGQTTIPGKIREALCIKPGDRLEYAVEGDHAVIRVHPGIRSLKGALSSKKGRGMSFDSVRAEAAKATREREGVR
jgi:AbrB family looped-hinge helix DNA binding protein